MPRLIGVPSSTCYMLTYDHLLNVTLPPLLPSSIVPLSAGILARTTITSLMSPLELVRTNLQSTPPSPDHPHTLRSVLTSIRSLAQSQGWHYLWRGLGPTLWRDVPFSGLYWAGYETTKRHLHNRGHEGAGVAFVSGAFSGTMAALLTSPFDVLTVSHSQDAHFDFWTALSNGLGCAPLNNPSCATTVNVNGWNDGLVRIFILAPPAMVRTSMN